MPVLVSGCYYHPDRAAVAFCAECGVGICQECAVNDSRGRVVCRQCANEELRQEHREYRKQIKASGGRFITGKDFLVPGIVGILIAIAGHVVLAFQGYYSAFFLNDYNPKITLMVLVSIMLTYVLCSIPFGWIISSELIPIYHSTTTMGLVNMLKWILRVAITFYFSWLVFTVLWVRFLIRKHRSKNSKS